MAIVTFWGQKDEETGQTLDIAAITTYMAIEHNYKILVLSTKYNDDTFETCFWEPSRNEDFKAQLAKENEKKANSDFNVGAEGLAKAMMSNKTSPELITNYTRVVFKENRLEVLTSIKNEDYQEYLRIRPIYKQIIQSANKYYDLVFVDLDGAFEEETTREILEISNLVVINLVQKLKTINDYLELKESVPELFKNYKVMYLIGKYDRFSKYNSKNVARYIGDKREYPTIPYCTLFFEACAEGKVVDYFMRFRNVSETDRNAVFIAEVKNSVAMIKDRLQDLQMRI